MSDPTNPSAAAPVEATVRVRMDLIVLAGVGAWVVALAVVLLVPELRAGERDWWPWACVAGVILGALGYAYVRRGRGNAAEADRPVPVPPAIERIEHQREQYREHRRD
ncbi:DUF2530 domain-containing protein [Janibacter sp. GXQ6167]|uniref:DUF2530 domain-containing protein n=1 Tax=Janibacter sp. GXQ6167 TaxID=3240791 RepID=UPI003526275F